MPNLKVSQLPTSSPLEYNEIMMLIKNGANKKIVLSKLFPEVFQLACSDRTTDLVAATNVASFHTMFGFTILEVQLEVLTASSSGIVEVDIKRNGSTIFTTKLSIDSGELTSSTAATPYVLNAGNIKFNRGDSLIVDMTEDGTGAKGLLLTILATRTGF